MTLLSKVFIILMSVIPFTAHSYVINKTKSGVDIKWSSVRSSIDFHVNSENNNSLNISDVNSIVSASVAQWNQYLTTNLRLFTSADGNISGQNDILFASKDSFFDDPGIIGVTQLVFDIDSGNIVETDIVLNDISFNLSSTSGDQYYLGDVLTHEVGHALGLSHGQVFGSSMFYRLRNGQSTVEHDDIGGLGSLYGAIHKGVIEGKIIGGNSLEGVFGVRVSAISENIGSVVVSVISKEDGSFLISGLPVDDTYFIYVHPLEALTTLPTYFHERKTNFCESGASFKGSFFQGCDSNNQGHPSGFNITNTKSKYSIGNISIKCSYGVGNEYLVNKSGGVTDLKIDRQDGSRIHIGEALTGYFSPAELLNNSSDKFEIDLSHLDFSTWPNSGEYYLEVKTLSQKLFSKLKLSLEVDLSNASTYKTPSNNNSIYLDSELNPIIDLSMRIPISTTDTSLNKFSIKVKPYDIDSYTTATAMNINNLFPSSNDFLNNEAFYFLSIRVVQKEVLQSGEELYHLITHRKYKNITDNTFCPDAPETYKVWPGGYIERAEKKVVIKRKDESNLPIACGSIDFPDKNDPAKLIFTLFFSLLIIASYHKSKLA